MKPGTNDFSRRNPLAGINNETIASGIRNLAATGKSPVDGSIDERNRESAFPQNLADGIVRTSNTAASFNIDSVAPANSWRNKNSMDRDILPLRLPDIIRGFIDIARGEGSIRLPRKQDSTGTEGSCR